MGERELRIEQFGLGDTRLRAFARLPWTLYRGDPCWTPPLDAELLGNQLLGVTGLLTPGHPYHEHAEVTHFMAWRGAEPVGRVSAAVDEAFNAFHDVRIAFFGFLDVAEDAEAATALLDAAREWARERGASALRGPGQYGCATHERQGVLVSGFGHPPTIDLTHNPPYLPGLVEGAGFAKVMDYHAFRFDRDSIDPARAHRLAARVRERMGSRLATRPADMSRFAEDVRLLVRIYNEVWSANWGFVPVAEEEADAIASSLRAIVDPGLVRFAFVDGEPAAVLGVLPDPYWALRPRWRWYGDSDAVRLARLFATRRRIPRLRAMFFGVREPHRRTGIDAVLFDEALAYGWPRTFYRELEGSMALETNELMLRGAEAMGGERYKTWRIYEAPL